MIAYVLDRANLKIKDFFYFLDYLFCDDIDYADKSRITAPKLANVTDDDFIICKDDQNRVRFFGLASDTSTTDASDAFSITLKPKEALFDRFIFEDDTSLLSTGIEDYIADCITDNWVSSGDNLMDRAFITPTAVTHTPVAASLGSIVNLEGGVFNLKTMLGNAKERYGIFVDFVLTDTSPAIATGPQLAVRIYKDSSGIVPIDTDVSDISEISEVYSVDVLAKLQVKWLNTTTEAVTYRTFYLTDDRTVTEDPDDPDRTDGIVKAIYVEAETEAGMLDAVTQEFQQNRYEHKISFSLREGSELYLPDDYYVGRQCMIETKTGVKASLITAIETESGSGVRRITMGKLRVTLTSKLRGKI